MTKDKMTITIVLFTKMRQINVSGSKSSMYRKIACIENLNLFEAHLQLYLHFFCF